jgi:hypothetical protein
VKNWGIKYCFFFLLFGILASCTNSTNRSFLKSNNSEILSIATDAQLADFDFYSNDAFSKFVKDLALESICYYDPVFKEVKSNVITQFRWIRENELELTVNTNILFHATRIGNSYKERKLSPKDVIRSIQLQQKNSKYSQVKTFLSSFERMSIKEKNIVVINLNTSVNPRDFLLELATCEIPVVTFETTKPMLSTLIGTGLYAINSVNERQITFNLFKNHLFSKANKTTFSLPEIYLVKLHESEETISKMLLVKNIDAAFISDINSFVHNTNFIEELFIRNEDNIHLAALNYERPFSNNYNDIEVLKKLINPEGFNAIYFNNQLVSYYSPYDIEEVDSISTKSLVVAFDKCDTNFVRYVKSNLKKASVQLLESDVNQDVIFYQLQTPTLNEDILNKYVFDYYASKHFIQDKKVSRDANVKLFHPVKYLFFTKRVKFFNTNFENRNDFSTVFKM